VISLGIVFVALSSVTRSLHTSNPPNPIIEQTPVSWKLRPPIQRPTRELHYARDSTDSTAMGARNFSDWLCLNTVQGKDLITDSSGSICLRSAVMRGGCCDPRKRVGQRSCKSCRKELGCCSSYEYCVSCCLDQHQPQAFQTGHVNWSRNSTSTSTSISTSTSTSTGRLFDKIIHRNNKNKKNEQKEYQMILEIFSNDDFDYCLHLCRTSSRNLKHGNEYRSELKHCYSESIIKHPQETPSLNTTQTTIFTAGVGVSCNMACSERNMVCAEEYLQAINNCEELQKHFDCQYCLPANSGGGGGGGHDPPAPGWVVSASQEIGAPLPKTCLVHSDSSFLDCKASHHQTQRLCICLSS